MKPIDLGTLLLLACMWGASFLFIRVASPALGPIVLVEVRVLIAGGALLLYAFAVGRAPSLRARLRDFLLLGTINAVLPFTLIAAAELTLTASFAAILNATTPLFTAIIAALWLDHALTPRRGVGLVLGFAGVAVTVGWSPVPVSGYLLLAVCASLAAALCYAVGFVTVSRYFAGVPAMTLSIKQQLAAGVILLPFAAARPPGGLPSAGVVMAVLALSLLGTSFGYILYFRLVERVGPTSTATVTFLVPLFGLIWSVIFLKESVTPGLFAGLAMILISVALVTNLRISRPRVSAGAAAPHAEQGVEAAG